MSSSTTSSQKNAEFAKLFDLFETLATRRSCKTPLTEADLDDTHTIPVPVELESVFNKLSNIVPPRGTRARRNTVATTVPEVDEDSDAETEKESIAKFPLQRMYKFTFRKMIHHLYQKQEWATKVRDVLKASKLEYKSLAEIEAEAKTLPVATTEAVTSPITPDGRVHFHTEVKIGGGKKTAPLVLQGRRRAASISGPSRDRRGLTSPTSPTHAIFRSPPTSPIQNHGAAEDTRAVKKRCIGRRKSVGGLESTPSGGWLYDASISSSEATTPVETRPMTNILNQPRQRHQSLQGQAKKPAPTRRRNLSTTVQPDGEVASPSSAAVKRRFSEF
ncbi:hypothetical protein MKEN_01078400 [Mycena kentingensis (nom. inval.)]|nr:hypothetical protein MKEN_01078400 [Mycena kentingensis (nom. inval.)]